MAKGERLRILLQEVGAVITDNIHVVYSSWRHGCSYINKDALYPYTDLVYLFCEEIAKNAPKKIEAVVGPATGGIVLSQWIAFHLSLIQKERVLAIYADKVRIPKMSLGMGSSTPGFEDSFRIGRGYEKLIVGKRVLVVEDVLNTGNSARKTVEAVRAAGGIVVGVSALVNRGDVRRHTVGDVPELISLLHVRLESWAEADCPLCQQGIPINTDIGHGKEFLERKKL